MSEAIGGNSSAQLRSYIERIESLLEEKAALGEDIAEVKKEAKGNGFDTGAIGRIIRRRKMDKDKLAEQEAIDETYLTALGML